MLLYNTGWREIIRALRIAAPGRVCHVLGIHGWSLLEEGFRDSSRPFMPEIAYPPLVGLLFPSRGAGLVVHPLVPTCPSTLRFTNPPLIPVRRCLLPLVDDKSAAGGASTITGRGLCRTSPLRVMGWAHIRVSRDDCPGTEPVVSPWRQISGLAP